MKKIRDEMVPLITKEEIKSLVHSLAMQIEHDYKGKEIVLVCPLKGSVHFVADLMRQMNLTQQVDFVQLTSSENDGVIKIIKDIGGNIVGKHVLIVEEIIDTGRTLNFLKNRLLASSPASLKIVTLLDKPARREISLKPEYVGKTIDDRYVVGYGMDNENLGRNYPDIYFLKN